MPNLHENTAVYEALRRPVGIMICTDCGAEPDYAWQDLANLIRLARIELGCSFEGLMPPASHAQRLSGKAERRTKGQKDFGQ